MRKQNSLVYGQCCLPKTRHQDCSHFILVLFKLLSSSIINACISAWEVCKSADILQAIRWTAMVWNEVSETTVVKCFIKAGILDSEGNINTVDSIGSDINPFADLESKVVAVQDLANETNGDKW